MVNFVALKMKKWSSQWTQFMQLRKVQDFNGVWTRDPAITWAMLYQLSYEATGVGSRSIVGSYMPVKEMSVNDIWNKSYMNCRNEICRTICELYFAYMLLKRKALLGNELEKWRQNNHLPCILVIFTCVSTSLYYSTFLRGSFFLAYAVSADERKSERAMKSAWTVENRPKERRGEPVTSISNRNSISLLSGGGLWAPGGGYRSSDKRGIIHTLR